MLRVLLVSLTEDPGDPDDPTFGIAARVLRDAGHEVVHGGAIGSAGQIAAVAAQEDIEVVLLVGERKAEDVAGELLAGATDELVVSVIRPGGGREQVLEAVRL